VEAEELLGFRTVLTIISLTRLPSKSPSPPLLSQNFEH